MHAFRLKVELDPPAEDKAVLAHWPRAPLKPDLETLASGWIALEFNGQPMLHDGATAAVGDPLNSKGARIGDTVFVFAQHLLDAAHQVRDGGTHVAGFGDSPACLVLTRLDDDRVQVAYRDDPDEGDLASATPTETDFLSAVKTAISHYVEELLTLNASLSNHPEVAALRDALRVM